MSERFLFSFKKWDERYGGLAVWLWRLVFYPFLFISLYAGKAYLDSHYVSKEYFDKAMETISEEKQRYAQDQKQDMREIKGKLDTLLESSAANAQRFSDYDRRLGNVEEKIDRLQERSAVH